LFHLEASAFKNIVLAYEPVWAIGTGETATPEQAQDMHAFIRKTLADKYGVEVADSVSILYGGSVKPANAQEIFSKPDEKQWLEALIHTLVFEASQQAFENTHSQYGIYISPLLIEKGIPSWINRVLIIDCDQNAQIDRASQRDNNTPEQIKAIMANQASTDERNRYANDILYNSGDLNALASQVESLHQKYLSLAEQF